MTRDALKEMRLRSWCVDGTRQVPNPEAAKTYIDRLGVVTLFNASPEVPNLYDAHMGRLDSPMDSKHDSPSGYVYSWRWELGKVQAAYYGQLVAKRPTWVAWETLPLVFGAFMERRHPEELHELGLISGNALRIASALEEARRPMQTDELRKAAGFPTGKENRSAYLKGLEELGARMITGKHFLPTAENTEVLNDLHYPEASAAARRMTPDEALALLLKRLLPEWVCVESKP
ncbi:MAG TPA: hypothetical protein VGE01_12840, partial [Fimbriimonas sp.]